MKHFKAVLDVIRRHQRFLVVSHHNPDSDAVASALVMAMFLKSLGKTPRVLNEEECPDWLRFLPGSAIFKAAGKVKSLDYDAAIVLDCGDLERTGSVKNLIKAGRPLINIDHHVTNDKFGSVNVVWPKASSTCEIMYEFLKEAGCPLNKNLSMLLYAGIMTDTGSFRFENTSGHTHQVAEKLMAFKFSANEMYDRLYRGIPVRDMKLFTDVIHGARLLDRDRVYCVSLPKKLIERFSKTFDLKEQLLTFLRLVEGIEVVVILTELNPKEIRVNLRSQKNFDVAKLAQEFNGGGHKKAAGCKIHETLEQARQIICEAIHQKL